MTSVKRGQGDGEGRGKKHKRPSKAETKLSFEFYLSEGNTYQNSGDFGRAITGYSKALDVRPDHKVCLLSRSECYLRLGDTKAAIVDANATLSDDPKFIKGIRQKANIYYQMGEFECALVLYHRGYKLRPDIDAFRLGIQLCQEAIDNCIGDKAQIKLEKKGDLSFFTELQQSGKDQADKRAVRDATGGQYNTQVSSTQNKKSRGPSDKDDKTVKQLLEELYVDKKFLETVMSDAEKVHKKSDQNEEVMKLSANCLNYLDSRATFWQQKQPTYARRKTQSPTEHQQKQQTGKARTTSDSAKTLLKDLEEIDEYYSNEQFGDCLYKCNEVMKDLDRCSDKESKSNAELRGNVLSYMGNSYLDMARLDDALVHHKADYKLAKKHKLEDALIRSLDNVGRTLVKQGKFTEALKIFAERSPMTSEALERAWLHHEIGNCHQQTGDYDKSRDHGQQSFDAAEEADDKLWQLNALILIAESYRGLKRQTPAVDTFERALEIAKSIGDESAASTIERCIDDISKQQTAQEETGDQSTVDGQQQSIEADSQQQQQDTAAVESNVNDDDVTKSDDVSPSMTSYNVTVNVSDVSDAGTDAAVYIELVGDRGASRRLELDECVNNKDHKFERGTENEFIVDTVDVGQLSSLRIGVSSDIPGSGPHIAQVKVHSKSSNETYVFACHQWLDKAHGDRLTVRELRPISTKSQQVKYHVKVKTGDDDDAGTDDKIYLQIFGNNGETESLLLDTTHASTNRFEPMQTSEFDLDAVNVGQVGKIRIGHRGSSSWLLEDVTVEVEDKSYHFKCSAWLDKDKGEGKTEMELCVDD